MLPESAIQGLISNAMQLFMRQDPKANVFHPDFETTGWRSMKALLVE